MTTAQTLGLAPRRPGGAAMVFRFNWPLYAAAAGAATAAAALLILIRMPLPMRVVIALERVMNYRR